MKNNTALIIGIIILGVVAVTFLDLDLFAFATEKPVCEITEFGGECSVDYILPANRTATTANFDFSFGSVPSPDFSQPVQITEFASGGEYKEESDTDGDSCYEDVKYGRLYLYRIPSDFGDVHDLKIYSETSATAKTQDQTTDVTIDIEAGYINIPYPYNNIPVCTKDRSSDCSGFYLVRDYSDSNNEDQYSIKYDSSGTLIDKQDIDIGSSVDVGITFNEQIYYEGIIENSDLITLGENRGQIALYVIIERDMQDRCGASSSYASPPSTFLSYRQAFFPKNVQYGIDGNYVATLEGVNKEPISSLNIADAINQHCGRTGIIKNTDECMVPLTFTSDVPGKIVIEKENSVLELAESNDQVLTGAITIGAVGLIGGYLFLRRRR